MEKIELFTLDEVASMLKKKRTTIYNYRKSGKLKAFGMSGKSPLFRFKDIENFITNSLKFN
ncbi:helix-turn-helix domain-containing protein [Epilithonimonas zeae]|uniref:helix-turn-helix domain-containing protein n=1 Tax=Epilithonimonas zeae TaxID=1416779 RepID=UPI00200C56C2|nr:helix-turn-helix domain-containing protein [Epilithonimonas zeae]UQB69451.1 helix-turn-helix domain-containing protein [Epilithonimonas zeae]